MGMFKSWPGHKYEMLWNLSPPAENILYIEDKLDTPNSIYASTGTSATLNNNNHNNVKCNNRVCQTEYTLK